MNATDIHIGQIVSADIFFRAGRYGGECDAAHIEGQVIDKQEC